MTTTSTTNPTWRKSSHSGGNGACVEIAVPDTRTIAVRDSKDPEGPRLQFSNAAWAAFTTAVAAGAFGEV
ncbi:DUF397 domain-containing protein [Streptomyces sp. NRRL B-24484]|uniref:DUF397 domain-containing protein n=1 Tax=Streptomyces sp. NRRL B-24484 TaxID=1463833 RepID=UPI0004C2A988|nr:DUF397 domain-containing protein [Streptomyces sp. NRRL B-24484]